MSNATSHNLAFAELAPHVLHLVVISGRKVVALRAFRPDAKADIAAFVAEHKLAGLVRVSILGERIFLHRSTEAEAGALRQPAVLQSHLGQLPHGFDGSPGAVLCDAATGLTPDAASACPWLLSVFDSASLVAFREILGEIGLAPAAMTLAAPAHIGAVAASLAKGEGVAVIIPGADEAWLVEVSAAGAQSVISVPLGFSQIFEAIQKGLGLKFRASAGKLFFNDTYDFTEAAPKICELLIPGLRQALEGKALGSVHVAGLTGGQAWFGAGLASALGLSPWKVSGASVAERVGLDAAGAELPFAAAGLLQVAAAGSSSAPWVQPPLEILVAEALAKPRSSTPVAGPKAAEPPALAPLAAPVAPVVPVTPVAAPVAVTVVDLIVAVAPVVSATPVKPATPVIKPVVKAAAPAAVIKPAVAPKPTSTPAVKPVPKAMPAAMPVASEEKPPRATETAVKRSKTTVFLALGVVAVGAIGGMAYHFIASAPSGPPPSLTVEQRAVPAPVADRLPGATTVPVTSAVPPPADLGNPARKFSNSLYRIEMSEMGFIQSLATSRGDILVESVGGITLMGHSEGGDERPKWFRAGGLDDAGCIATVTQSVNEGVTVFDVVIKHSRFKLEQSFTCLPNSVKVAARFTPINLSDSRGVVAAVQSVRLPLAALNSSMRMRASVNSFAYPMKLSTLRVQFDPTAWARDGAGGLQRIIASESSVEFHFTDNIEQARNTLNYEIQLGSAAN